MTVEVAIEKKEFKSDGVAVIAAAHGIHDTYTAFLSPLLPVLIQKLLLSKTQAGLLSFFLQAPSLLQPLFGFLGDRYDLRFVVVLAPAVTATLMSLVGIAPTYGLIAVLLLMAGTSSAALHSIGPVIAGTLSGNRLGRGMSFWMVGGEIGRTLGPIVIVTAITYLTLPRLPWLIVGGVTASLILLLRLRNISIPSSQIDIQVDWRGAIQKMGPVLGMVSAIILARAFLQASLSTYLPTLLTDQGSNLWFAGASLSIMEIGGVLGALLGGSLSDHFGRRKVLVIAILLTPLLTLGFLNVSNAIKPFILLGVGFCHFSIVPVLMAIVLENCTESRSLANSIFMLVSFGISSLAIVVIGLIGDTWGLQQAFTLASFAMFLGIPLVIFLPKSVKRA